MTDLEPVLEENRKAVGEFVAQARSLAPGRWNTPCAPGKWSPGQVCEHIAKSYEKSCGMLRGEPQPGMPRLLRPLLRVFFFNKVLKSGSFPKGAKSPEQFQPSSSPAPVDEGLERIEKASADFGAEARRRDAPGATVDHPVFGRIRVVDYVRLAHIHTRHHAKQLV